MIVRAEAIWGRGEGEGETLKWVVCVEYPSGKEECFEVKQLFVNSELEKEPAYTVYFFEAVEVRVSEDEVEVIT